jgi:DNA-binding transcriptional MerR regulator
MEQLITIGQVARQLGVTVCRVRQLDAELQPARGTANERRYHPERVEALAAARRTGAERLARRRLRVGEVRR